MSNCKNSRSRIREIIWFVTPTFYFRVSNFLRLFFRILEENFERKHKCYNICNKSSIVVLGSIMHIHKEANNKWASSDLYWADKL